MDKTRKKTFDIYGVAPWSDLNHEMLLLVMMQLGVIDFLAFSGVCKSWRSFALSNMNIFMTSRPPMSMCISNDVSKKGCYCYLEDFEGRKFKTHLPYFGRTVGCTCGYLVLFRREACDFWLVNPITRHELHFPDVPFFVTFDPKEFNGILVFSRSVSGWVFVVFSKFTHNIWFCIAGKGAWIHVYSTFGILDLHAFKGKIYTIDIDYHLHEMRLGPEPNLTLLQIKNFPKREFLYPLFLSSGEKLYVMDRVSMLLPEFVNIGGNDLNMFQELDFGEMKWMSREERTIREYVFFISYFTNNAAIKPESWALPLSQYGRYDCFRKGRCYVEDMWYFPHDCLNVNTIDE